MSKRCTHVVNEITGCWEWQGSLSNGYGRTWVDGKCEQAHVDSYRKHNDDWEPGLDVCHSCDNRKCIRPDHLFLGTRKDNMQDAVSKDRHMRGTRHPDAKLNDDSVRLIRRAHKERTCTVVHMAKVFKVSRSIITDIIYGRRWKHVLD